MDYIPQTTLSFRDTDLINEYLVRVAHGFVYSSTNQPIVEAFVREHLYSLRFFEHLIRNDVENEVDQMLSGLLE